MTTKEESNKCPKKDIHDTWTHTPKQEPHVCPYKMDIHDDNEKCECCEQCMRECAMDV